MKGYLGTIIALALLLTASCTTGGTPSHTVAPSSMIPSPVPPPAHITARSLDKVAGKIRDAQKEFPGTMGALFYDIKSRLRTGIADEQQFPAASVIKVPVMIEIFRQQQQGKIGRAQKLTLRAEDITGGSGVVKDSPPGTDFTVKELLMLMITKSDNTATDMLIDLAGMDSINGTMKGMGLQHTSVRRKIFDFDALDRGIDNVTTPGDIMKLLLALHQRDDQDSREMISLLCRVERKDMLPSGLPEGTRVAHKTGELSGTLLDAGIVYHRKSPFILCLMGKDITDREKAVRCFAGLTAAIYHIVEKSTDD